MNVPNLRSEDPIQGSENAKEIGRAPKVLRRIARYAIGIALLAFLIARSGIENLRHVLATADARFVLLAFGLILLGAVVSVIRWSVFVNALGYRTSFGRLAKLYAAGLFFNSLLPTGIGGDVFKALRLRSKGKPLGGPVASVVLDRLAGFVGLAILGVIAALARLAAADHSRVVVIGGVLSALGVVGVVVVYGARSVIDRVLTATGRWKIMRRLQSVTGSLTEGTRNTRASGTALAWGIAYQAIVVAFHVALLRSIHTSAPVAALVCVVVVVTFASLLPITINGLGIREGAYVWALKQYGLQTGAAIVIGLLTLALLLAASAIGGVVYLLGGFDVPPVETTDT